MWSSEIESPKVAPEEEPEGKAGGKEGTVFGEMESAFVYISLYIYSVHISIYCCVRHLQMLV